MCCIGKEHEQRQRTADQLPSEGQRSGLCLPVLSCPRKGTGLCHQLKRFKNGFCTEHGDKNVGEHPNITEASFWTYSLKHHFFYPLPCLTLAAATALQDLSHTFSQWPGLAFAWLCFLSHILSLSRPGKLTNTWKIIQF